MSSADPRSQRSDHRDRDWRPRSQHRGYGVAVTISQKYMAAQTCSSRQNSIVMGFIDHQYGCSTEVWGAPHLDITRCVSASTRPNQISRAKETFVVAVRSSQTDAQLTGYCDEWRLCDKETKRWICMPCGAAPLIYVYYCVLEFSMK